MRQVSTGARDKAATEYVLSDEFETDRLVDAFLSGWDARAISPLPLLEFDAKVPADEHDRAVAEAAAKQALEDAADEFFNSYPNGQAYNGYRVAMLLRARAASISTDKAGEGDCLNCEEPILPGQLKAHYVGRGDVHQNCPTDEIARAIREGGAS